MAVPQCTGQVFEDRPGSVAPWRLTLLNGCKALIHPMRPRRRVRRRQLSLLLQSMQLPLRRQQLRQAVR